MLTGFWATILRPSLSLLVRKRFRAEFMKQMKLLHQSFNIKVNSLQFTDDKQLFSVLQISKEKASVKTSHFRYKKNNITKDESLAMTMHFLFRNTVFLENIFLLSGFSFPSSLCATKIAFKSRFRSKLKCIFIFLLGHRVYCVAKEFVMLFIITFLFYN